MTNHNDQSLVEICITRLTSAIRETRSIERHAEPLVNLLETCLTYNLRPVSGGPDPPHAKIASDVMSCIFLVCIPTNYSILYWSAYNNIVFSNNNLLTYFMHIVTELQQENCHEIGFTHFCQIPTQRKPRFIKKYGFISIVGSYRKCWFTSSTHTANHRFGYIR